MFQSPSLRGSGRFDGVRLALAWEVRVVSIPFIAGQWSLPPPAAWRRGREDKFQSPSLRGSGHFADADQLKKGLAAFQSPSLRGSGHFTCCEDGEVLERRVSIPFIAGQWSLPLPPRRGLPPPVVVSIPFIAGQWSLLIANFAGRIPVYKFQSPSLRGSGRF